MMCYVKFFPTLDCCVRNSAFIHTKNYENIKPCTSKQDSTPSHSPWILETKHRAPKLTTGKHYAFICKINGE